MKKLLAILLAFSMLFAFAACGGNDNDDTTTTTAEDIFAGLEDESTEAPADESTEAPSEDTSAVSEEDSTAASEATSDTSDASAAESTTAASAGLNSTDAAEVVAYYAAAVKKTNKVTDTEKMALADEITGDGFIGAALSILQPIIESVLADQGGTKERGIPGSDDGVARIKASDVSKAVASSKNGKTTIAIQLKDQVDGPDEDAKTAGPVARGIGTLGSIDGALEALGATISSGRDTVKLTYKNSTIKVVVDEKTGKIVDGSWKYDIDLNIGNAAISMAGINLNAKNLHTIIAYSVEM